MVNTLLEIFFVAFFINLLYEILHSLLYETCLKMPLKKYVRLILRASFFDGIWISAIYLITYLIFGNKNVFSNYFQLILFSVLSIASAYLWELYSIKNKKWEYSSRMPLIFGAGITPTLQIFITGLITFYIVFVLRFVN